MVVYRKGSSRDLYRTDDQLYDAQIDENVTSESQCHNVLSVSIKLDHKDRSFGESISSIPNSSISCKRFVAIVRYFDMAESS